jgi:hypothetical protein
MTRQFPLNILSNFVHMSIRYLLLRALGLIHFQRELHDPRPLAWTIQHRFVSLALILGIFSQLEKLLNVCQPGLRGPGSIASIFAPQSDERNEFCQKVVDDAQNFMHYEKSLMDGLISTATSAANRNPKENVNIQIAFNKAIRNKALAERMAMLAKPAVSHFFRCLENVRAPDRGEANTVPFKFNYLLKVV